LAIDDVTVAEDGGQALFTVTLNPRSESAVSVAYATENGTATAGEDYDAISGTLSFPPGDTTRTIAVTILDDSAPEAIEEFAVALNNPQNATLLDGQGTGTITDNDADNEGRVPSTPSSLPRLAIDDVVLAEDAGPASFTLVLSKESDKQVTVSYATADGSAQAGSDYTAASGIIAFPPGETRKVVSVAVHDDDEAEGHETFSVRLSNPRYATLSDSSGTATIKDDEYDGVRVSYGAASYTVAEGGSVNVEVVLSAAPNNPVDITLIHVPGPGAGPDDYSGVPGSVSIDATESTTSFRFVAAADDEDDDGEFVSLSFGPLPPGVTAGAPVQSAVTIADTPPPVAQVPADWLRQFGQTAVSDVVDAIDERMRCARDRRPDDATDADGGRWRCTGQPDASSFSIDGQVLARLAAAATDAGVVAVAYPDPQRAAGAAPAVTIPIGSTFLSTSAQPESPQGMSVWGRGTYSRFDHSGALLTGGDVWTATLGADFAFRQAVLGVALAHSESEGNASQSGIATDVTSVLTGLYPYLRVGLNDRLSVWGTIGVGTGTLTHVLPEAPSLRSGIAMTMAAAGGLAEILAAEHGGLSVAVKADGMLMQIESDGTTALPTVLADASRVRLVLESTYEVVLRDRQRIAPFLELGGRLDGTDSAADSGIGFEIGGGVRYANPAHHLTAEVYSRTLLSHAADGLRNWSASGSLRYDPRSGSAQGPYLTVASSRGSGPLGGPAAPGLADLIGAVAQTSGDAAWGLSTEFGYGVLMPGGAATGTPWAGLSLMHGVPEYRIGYRLKYDTGLHLSLAATLRNDDLDQLPYYLITLLLSFR
jgi:opacity protein-like surface antigen